jgi:hypothetical protein
MISGFSRREFFAGMGGLVAGAAMARGVFAEAANFCSRGTQARSNARDVRGEQAELLYPPVDLSYFEKQIGRGA